MLLVGVLALIGMIPAIAWYAWVMPAWGPAGIEGEVLFHPEKWPLLKEILTYHFWQVLPRTVISVGVLPFIVLGIFALMRKRAALGIENGMLGPIWVVGIGFGCFWLYALGIIAIPHDYYFLPLVPIFALLAALGANFGFQKFPMWASVILILLILVVPFMTTRRVADRWKIEKSEFNRDLFSYQNELREAVPNDALVVAGPDFSHMVFLYYINKKGWSWDKNQGLSPEKLRDWRSRGAQFLYCDDRDFDNAADIQPMIGAPLYEYGSVRIFRIKTE